MVGGGEGRGYNDHLSCPDGLIVDILALHTGLSAIVLCPDFALLVNMSGVVNGDSW